MNYSFTTSIGVDVSKCLLDVYCDSDGTHERFDNSPDGINKLIRWIAKRAEQALVVIEPTGGYEHMLQHMVLTNKTMHLAKVNARQIREFARAKGRIAKTDSIDARILAEYGIAMRPRILTMPPAYRQELRAMVTRRQQISGTIARERTRLDRTLHDIARQSIDDVIAFLRQQLRDLDAVIRGLIAEHSELKDLNKLIRSVTGIGPQTAAVLMAELPELGRIDHKSISSLVGVAPHNVDSGTMRGKRTIHGGREAVRNKLYMAALSAIRYHDELRDFYQRLILRGKTPKVAIVAAMRKLLIILNAKVRDFYAQTT